MSFDKITLPDVLLADLYKESLIVIDSDVKQVTRKPKDVPAKKEPVTSEPVAAPIITNVIDAGKPLSYLGNNQKHISIVVTDANAIHLQDDLLDILSAILSACRLNLADVAIINNHSQLVNDQRLKNEMKATSVLLFGIGTSEIGLPFSIPDYKIQQFNNCAYLQASALEKMRGSSNEARLEKSKLWVCLKTLFNV